MKHACNVLDLWIFHREDDEPRYLLMRTSQEKADKWFGGGRFWQIPGEFFENESEGALDAISRCIEGYGFTPSAIFACEYVYTIYNRRFDQLQTIPVFAAELTAPSPVNLTWHHSESGWFTASEVEERINFWGLRESFKRTREYISECRKVPDEFCLWKKEN